MTHFFADMWSIITSLSFIDYVLYFAVIVLIMLIVSLIYVMKEEKFEEDEPKKEIPISNQNEEIDLKAIMDTIDENPEPLVDMTAYEEEQEKKAIISYDELVRAGKNVINYDKEEMVDDLIPVKKISLNPMDSISLPILKSEPKVEVDSTPIKLFSYEKEEEFLKTLQKLNELLN